MLRCIKGRQEQSVIVPWKQRLEFSLSHFWPSQGEAEARYDPSSLFPGCHICALGDGMCIEHEDMLIESSITSHFLVYAKDISVNTAEKARGLRLKGRRCQTSTPPQPYSSLISQTSRTNGTGSQ